MGLFIIILVTLGLMYASLTAGFEDEADTGHK